jgi:hypothetical protein
MSFSLAFCVAVIYVGPPTDLHRSTILLPRADAKLRIKASPVLVLRKNIVSDKSVSVHKPVITAISLEHWRLVLVYLHRCVVHMRNAW